ncbi:serine hydrolase domain-containing protein [Streptomyces sp. NPDC058374]|uniref:serine hydrolase domain-containing protein n=1 Tax=Streptomyces sp. NPDC058374 TaxID=3346466 RepID=UPI00365B2828
MESAVGGAGVPGGPAAGSAGIAALFEELVREHRVTGAQLAVYRDGALTECATGVASVRTGEPVTPRTGFPFGSVTKFLTAELVMQFVSDGDLDLDEPLAGLLPDLKRAADPTLGTATVRQLLSHTAGVADSIEYSEMRGPSYRRFAGVCAQAPNLFPPGLAFSYSNTGYCLLGAVVEAASGMDWWTAMDSCLLRPLGIEPAFLHDPRPGQGGVGARPVAEGHALRAGSEVAERVDHMTSLSLAAAGGLVGSATDLVTAARPHLADREGFAQRQLLPEDAVRQMRTCVPDAEPFGLADGWGLGLMRHRDGDDAWYGHDGAVGGATCNLRIHPGRSLAVALTTNSTAGPRLWEALVARLPETGLDVGHYALPVPDSAPTAPLADHLGTYANGDLELMVVRDPSGGLFLTRESYSDYHLSLHEDDLFVARDREHDSLPIVGRFVRERPDGPVVLLQYGGRAMQRL